MPKSIWTQLRRDGQWENKVSGSSKAYSIHRTQYEAIKEAIKYAKKHKCEHIIKGEDEKIREKKFLRQ